MVGAEELGSHVTNADGLIEVADGDFEYALSFERWFDHVFVDEARSLPWRLVTDLTEATTEIVAHQFAVRPLEMRIHRGDQPAAGVHLQGHLTNCPGGVCGACSGPITTTDEAGRIWIDNFRPDKYRWVWILDDGQKLWRTELTSWPEGVIDVQLSPFQVRFIH